MEQIGRDADRAAELALSEVELHELYKKTYYGRFMILMGWDVKPLFVPRDFSLAAKNYRDQRVYDLNNYERFFVGLNDPQSCIIASFWSNCMMAVIFLNLIIGIMMTIGIYRNIMPATCDYPVCNNDPIICPGQMICEPIEAAELTYIDTICVIIFTIEYGMRMIYVWFIRPVNVRLVGIVPKGWDAKEKNRARLQERDALKDPKVSRWYPPFAYATMGKNIIDILAVLPFYISLGGSGVSLSFIRVLRLLRILRAFKIRGGGVAKVMVRSLKNSLEPLLLLLASSALIVLIYGSVIFNLEHGTYQWRCDWGSGFDNSVEGPCRGGYLRTNTVDSAIEVSPFHSTLSGMYWAIITITTVGYGDFYPTSSEGRCMAVLCAFTGLILLAMPISILGNNFSIEYRSYKKALLEEREFQVAKAQKMREAAKEAAERNRFHAAFGSGARAPFAAEDEDKGKDAKVSKEGFAEKIIIYRASHMQEASNFFECLDFKFDDASLPELLPAADAHVKKRGLTGGDSGEDELVHSLYEQTILYENAIMSKAMEEHCDIQDTVLLLSDVLGKLRMSVRENESRGRKLQEVHSGFDHMSTVMKVLQSLQQAQEIGPGGHHHAAVSRSESADRLPRVNNSQSFADNRLPQVHKPT